MKRFAAWLLLLFAATGAAQPAPIGLPASDKSPRDVEFGVASRMFGLERRVEMYQWRAADRGYEKVWSTVPIPSAGFARGHDNPQDLPLASRRFLPGEVNLDGKPLDPEAIARLGEWRALRPNFSALPGNLSATFQPEGDGLGSAENPLDPQIGDLRITWRELALPTLDGKVALESGVWKLRPQATAEPVVQAGMPAAGVGKGTLGWLIGAGVFVLLILVIAAILRNRRR